MTDQIAGFPYWQFQFGEDGKPVTVPDEASLAEELQAAQVTDLFMFSHGWNNSQQAARDLYGRFFDQVAPLASGGLRPNATIGVAGVIWPSMLWADEPPPGSGAPALAGHTRRGRPATDAKLVRDLKKVFTRVDQRAALDELAMLLRTRPNNEEALRRFQHLMAVLMPKGRVVPPEDRGQRALVQKEYRKVFERMASAAQLAGVLPTDSSGAGPEIGVSWDWLWDGAKQALRQASYFQMKHRAGVVGQKGLGPYIRLLHAAAPGLRVHLLGHSFGARLVSFSLLGLAGTASGGASPVKSLTLLQGAFSHFAFAASLPQAPTRAGALDGMSARVDGPLVVSFTRFDTALGILYPWASMAGGQDASIVGDPLYPWGAMGHDGAQAVNATSVAYGPPGTSYPFAPREFLNLDGNAVMVTGAPPAGAHGDICHPQVAWALLAAAGIAG
jgi:hypothetical protein